MKLSEITKIKNFRSATIYILRNDLIVCEIFVIGRIKPIKKLYGKFEIDLKVVRELNIDTVKHLGIKRYRYWQRDKEYVNIYNY